MGILANYTDKLLEQHNNKLFIKEALSPDTWYTEPGAITWFYLRGQLYYTDEPMSHGDLQRSNGLQYGSAEHYSDPLVRISPDKSQMAIYSKNGYKGLYATDFTNAILGLYNRDLINVDTLIYTHPEYAYSKPITLKEYLHNVYANEPKEDVGFSYYSFVYRDGKLHITNANTFKDLATKFSIKDYNHYKDPSGRVINDSCIAVMFTEDEAEDSPFSDSLIALASSHLINQDSAIIAFYNSDLTDSTMSFNNFLLRLAQRRRKKKKPEILPNYDFEKAPEKSFDITEEIEFTFGFAKDTIHKYMSLIEDIREKMESEYDKIPQHYNLKAVVEVINQMYSDFSAQYQVFEDAEEQGIITLKLGMVYLAQRKVAIPRPVYNIRVYLKDIFNQLSTGRKEMLEIFNFIDSLEPSKEKRVLKWEVAYTSNLFYTHMLEIAKLYNDYRLWIQPMELDETQVTNAPTRLT